MRMREGGEIGKSSTADQKNQGQTTGKRRPKLTAGIEQETALQPFKPAGRCQRLLFAKANRQFLIKVGRRLRHPPGIEQSEGRLKGFELLIACSTGCKMRAGSCIRAGPWIKEEIRENGLAVLAVHCDPFQFSYASDRCDARVQPPEGLDKVLQLFAKRLIGAKKQRFCGRLA